MSNISILKGDITTASTDAIVNAIHTVGPHYQRHENPEIKLKSAYLNCLKLASSNDCQSIAFPALSCGAYAYPIQKASEIALNTCFFYSDKALKISFYLFDDTMLDCWKKTYQLILKEHF